ncbi:MAG: hypothetical protein FD145_35 [Candidatus Saganbacteria bacterium]|uniref:Methyltransferase FkbM domain-containing protein n=1 Tax=Candidatus Saganbacteria bacterium TaxID=2575572 RepID=A0A833NZ67_UNCSA|nr:MAG: hypothetical protein FD145_35 [Candidatus Saganbacteria bacterium]
MILCKEDSFKQYFNEHPLNLVDIGFRDGVQKKWEIFGKYLSVIGFEPDKVEYKRLIEKLRVISSKKGAPTYNIYDVALYKEPIDNLDLYITKNGNLCSILEPNRAVLDEFPETDRFDVLKKGSIKADKLDNVFFSKGIKSIDFIKIDVQGVALYVLQGAEETLNGSVFGLEIEVEFLRMYKDQPLFGDVDKFLRDKGFHLFDLKKYFWRRKAGLGFDGSKRGQLIHADALYLRDVDSYLDLLQSNIKDVVQKKALVLKAISICQLFGYSDYVLLFCQKAKAAKIFSDKEAETIDNLFREKSVFVLPKLWGVGRLKTLARKINKLFEDNYHGWAMVDKNDVGNNCEL